jgi:hypothetical protein
MSQGKLAGMSPKADAGAGMSPSATSPIQTIDSTRTLGGLPAPVTSAIFGKGTNSMPGLNPESSSSSQIGQFGTTFGQSDNSNTGIGAVAPVGNTVGPIAPDINKPAEEDELDGLPGPGGIGY